MEKDTRAKAGINGVKEADQKEDVMYVAVTITQESVHRIKRQEKGKGKTMVTPHRDNGQSGIPDSERGHGKTGGQAKVRVLEKAKERASTE